MRLISHNSEEEKEILKNKIDQMGLFMQHNTIPTDLCMRNIIQSCLDYKNSQSVQDRANHFICHIIDQPPSIHYMHILMGLFDQIINMDNPLEEYSQFFMSKEHVENESTSFFVEIKQVFYAYQKLPRNSDTDIKLHILSK